MNGVRRGRSNLLDSSDPVAMHLLMETAIGDSQQYNVVSFEEADELKNQIAVLSARIDATKRKLAMETKIRDASTSINRLHNPNSRDSIIDGPTKQSSLRHRRSLMSRGSGSDLLNKTDEELAATNKKCEDLAQELWTLEKQLQESQTKLLEHTAGVLQMTHKGFLKEDQSSRQTNGSNGFVDEFHDPSLPDILGDLDDSSFYRNLDALLEQDKNRGNSHAMAAFEQQTQSILEIERKMWDLNRRLRDSISQVSAGRQVLPPPPAPDSREQQNTEAALRRQLGYLEDGLDTMQRSQADILQGFKRSAYTTEESLADLNNQLHAILTQSGSDKSSQHALPPEVSGRDPQGQIAFLGDGLDNLEQSVKNLKDDSQISASRSHAHEQRVGLYEGTLQNLWQNLITEEENWRQQDPPPSERSVASKESYSLESFAAKVQSLHTRSAGLQEQKDILSRQIQQQRELNNQSDGQRDRKLSELTAELEQVKSNLEATNSEHRSVQDVLKAQLTASDETKSQLLSELQEKHNQISGLEAQLQALIIQQDSHVDRAKNQEETIQAQTAEAERAQSEMQNLEGEMVRLQTELTVARAELDGAYGTRAQRAAEVASHPALLQEISDLKERNTALESASTGSSELSQRVQFLQKELSDTIGEYESMTKASIEYEKEREHLENTIDGLRDRCETLETQLSDEKVKWLGVKSPGRPDSRESMGAGSTSTSVLKNEFKKMMRDTRTENMKALRVSHSNS